MLPQQCVPIIPNLDLSSMQESSKELEVMPEKNAEHKQCIDQGAVELSNYCVAGNTTTYACDYHDMKGIDHELCMHRIYINDGYRPITQPQR